MVIAIIGGVQTYLNYNKDSGELFVEECDDIVKIWEEGYKDIEPKEDGDCKNILVLAERLLKNNKRLFEKVKMRYDILKNTYKNYID